MNENPRTRVDIEKIIDDSQVICQEVQSSEAYDLTEMDGKTRGYVKYRRRLLQGLAIATLAAVATAYSVVTALPRTIIMDTEIMDTEFQEFKKDYEVGARIKSTSMCTVCGIAPIRKAGEEMDSVDGNLFVVKTLTNDNGKVCQSGDIYRYKWKW